MEICETYGWTLEYVQDLNVTFFFNLLAYHKDKSILNYTISQSGT